MKTQILAAFAFIGAPCLGIDFYRNTHSGEQWSNPVLSSVLDILYITGWICTMFALIRIKAAGEKKAGKVVLYLQTVFLFLAGASDVVTLMKIPIPQNIFFYWDFSWPLSNCMMLATSIAIGAAGVLKGWKRWVPLITGLWLPVTLLVKLTLGSEYMSIIGGTYSIVMWTLLASVAFAANKTAQRALAPVLISKS
jgi:hypothetical protein